MPLIAISAEEMEAGLTSIRPDLRYLLDDRGVPEAIIGRIGHLGITRMNVFAKIEADDSKVRDWLEADIGLRGSEGATQRVQTALVLDAWEAAKDRVVKQNDLESEQRALGLQRKMLKGGHLEIRRALEKVRGKLKDSECPSRTYIEWRVDQLEEGELLCETLDIVTTVKMQEQKQNLLQLLDLKKDGSLRVKHTPLTAELPRTPEELRQVYGLMGAHWQMVKLKNPSATCLAGDIAEAFDKLIKYLLGEDVWMLQTQSEMGAKAAETSWFGLLSYEYEIRRAAIRLANDGDTVAEALDKARKDQEVRMRYFIEPMALNKPKVQAPPARPVETGVETLPDEAGPKIKKKKLKKGGAGGSGGGGGGQGAGTGSWYNKVMNNKKFSATKRKMHFYTPDKKRICFKYQKNKCNSDQCTFAHVCAMCFGDHPFEECKNWSS